MTKQCTFASTPIYKPGQRVKVTLSGLEGSKGAVTGLANNLPGVRVYIVTLEQPIEQNDFGLASTILLSTGDFEVV